MYLSLQKKNFCSVCLGILEINNFYKKTVTCILSDELTYKRARVPVNDDNDGHVDVGDAEEVGKVGGRFGLRDELEYAVELEEAIGAHERPEGSFDGEVERISRHQAQHIRQEEQRPRQQHFANASHVAHQHTLLQKSLQNKTNAKRI